MMKVSDREALEFALVKDDILQEKARSSFKHFVAYTKGDYQLSWHNLLLMKKLQGVADGNIKKLLVLMPPRHGKSELVSRRFPAYMFGRNPDLNVIGASYSMSLAAKMNREIQRIIVDPRYQAVFPNVRLGTGKDDTKNDINYLKNTEIFEIADYRGMYRAAGVGTGITGMGYDLGSIDDPVKDQDAAMSKVQRDRAWEWFTSTFFTRAQKNAALIVTLTRWHEDDLGGRILSKIEKKEPGFENWEVLCLPAEAKEIRHPADKRNPGDALWPDMFNKKQLADIRNTIGSSWWNSLYQQSPSSEQGNIIQRNWFKFYVEQPKSLDEIIQSWDLTFKETGTSYVVGQVWGRKGREKYLLDQVRRRMGFVETIQSIKTMKAKWPNAYRILIEEAANGSAVIETLKREIGGIVPCRPDGSKEARAHAAAAQIEAGDVHLPKDAPWVHDYLEEWVMFPNGTDDDQVDATTQALRKLEGSAIQRLEKLLDF